MSTSLWHLIVRPRNCLTYPEAEVEYDWRMNRNRVIIMLCMFECETVDDCQCQHLYTQN